MGTAPRVALFADSFHEVNGLALTARSLEAFARARGLPLLSVRGSIRTGAGPGPVLDLARSPLSLPLDLGLSFDPLWPRHVTRAARALDLFRPDVVHITGINDMGQLGAWLAHRRRIPVVGSWHTNVHEFAARRLGRLLGSLPDAVRRRITSGVERAVWKGLVQFYRIPQALLVPNEGLCDQLQQQTGRPAFLMRRGVDGGLFAPSKRDVDDDVFRIGYVGRLSPEKNVRMLADVEARIGQRKGGTVQQTADSGQRGAFSAERAGGSGQPGAGSGERAARTGQQGASRVQFLIVGDGPERAWLERTMRDATFPGVLHGDALARAYARMDVFIFPSETDTFGNVVLEALASGVPVVVTARGGPRSIVEHGTTGFVVSDADGFADSILHLRSDGAVHARMRAAARAHALAHSWDAVFERVYDVYAAVAGARSPAGHDAVHGVVPGAAPA